MCYAKIIHGLNFLSHWERIEARVQSLRTVRCGLRKSRRLECRRDFLMPVILL
jgi:hypothetical protein